MVKWLIDDQPEARDQILNVDDIKNEADKNNANYVILHNLLYLKTFISSLIRSIKPPKKI